MAYFPVDYSYLDEINNLSVLYVQDEPKTIYVNFPDN